MQRDISREDMAKIMQLINAEADKLRAAGQKEYAHEEENAFNNFDTVGKLLNISPEKVLLVYALKHLFGIIADLNGEKSQRENVKGRIFDFRVYLDLLFGMYLRAEGWEQDQPITKGWKEEEPEESVRRVFDPEKSYNDSKEYVSSIFEIWQEEAIQADESLFAEEENNHVWKSKTPITFKNDFNVEGWRQDQPTWGKEEFKVTEPNTSSVYYVMKEDNQVTCNCEQCQLEESARVAEAEELKKLKANKALHDSFRKSNLWFMGCPCPVCSYKRQR